MTELAYVNELRWRWVPNPDDPKATYPRVKELGYWCDGEWHAVPTEEITDESCPSV